jgi:acetyltransferase-like isoleucine patch superfamily enzyme
LENCHRKPKANSLAKTPESDSFVIHQSDSSAGGDSMSLTLESVVLRLKRADTPFFRAARQVVDSCLSVTMPIPRLVKPAGRIFYELRFYVPRLWKRFKSLIYTRPIFSCRCESVGKRLQLLALPEVRGHTALYIGDDVQFSGSLKISSGRFCNNPTLRIGSRTFIGHNVVIACNREVIIEDDVLISTNCRISDYDGHSASFENRLSSAPPNAEDIQPVRISKGAWIGSGACILKGVTIGTGSIVGANSVVTHDVPPYCVAAGSPARVMKHIGSPGSGNIADAVAPAA